MVSADFFLLEIFFVAGFGMASQLLRSVLFSWADGGGNLSRRNKLKTVETVSFCIPARTTIPPLKRRAIFSYPYRIFQLSSQFLHPFPESQSVEDLTSRQAGDRSTMLRCPSITLLARTSIRAYEENHIKRCSHLLAHHIGLIQFPLI